MKKIALALVLFFSSGCITTSVTPLGSSTYPATDSSQVQIFLSERDVPAPFDKIGLIYARGDSAYTDQQMMLAKGRQEAAKLGANGLLVQSVDEASQGAKVAATIFGTNTQRHGEMVAIRIHYDREQVSPSQEGAPETGGITGEPTGEASTKSFDEWLAEKDDPEN